MTALPAGAASAPDASPRPEEPASGAPTNTLAVAALVSAFFVPIGAIVLGHVALGRIARTGEQGRGLAIAGLVIGYSTIALLAAFVVGSVGILLTVAAIPSGFPAP